jgi:hypothetical protein
MYLFCSIIIKSLLTKDKILVKLSSIFGPEPVGFTLSGSLLRSLVGSSGRLEIKQQEANINLQIGAIWCWRGNFHAAGAALPKKERQI